MRRVAVTGLGVVSPLGNTAREFFDSLLAGRSGVKRLCETDTRWSGVRTRIAAQVDLESSMHFTKSELLTLDRCAQFGIVATRQAVKDAGIDTASYDGDRVGVYWGTGMGGASTIDDCAKALYRDNASRVSPFSVIRIMSNAAASQVALDYGFRGPCLTFSNACASSAIAIGEGFRAIQAGHADAIIAGGSEALLTHISVKTWEALRTLATEDKTDYSTSCRPFSKSRSGFVLGEGAGCVVMEDYDSARRRGATIYAEILSYGSTCDATHITKPSAEGQARAMTIALRSAGVRPEDVDYINAHGTATVAGDEAETNAIKSVFGDHAYKVPVSSTKSMHGHLLGATGAIEFIATVLAVKEDVIPPTAHLNDPDPNCDLDYVPNVARNKRIGLALTNSFAFGGTNAVLAMRKPEASAIT